MGIKSISLATIALVLSTSVNAASIGFGSNAYYTNTLENNLVSQGHTATVYGSYDSVTLAELDVYIQEGNSFFNAALLDEFVFNGGILIQLPWTFTHNDYTAATTVMGARTSFSYGLPNPGINTLDSGNWLLSGVSLPNAGEYTIGREVGNVFDANTTQVLEWDDGTAMLGYREYGEGMVIGLNLHLITSDASPINADWSNQIIYNAVVVPVPAAVWLFGTGLLGLVGVARRKKA